MGIFGWWLSSALALGMCVGMEGGRGCKYVGVSGERRRREGYAVPVCVCVGRWVGVCGYVCVVNISLCSLVLTSVTG